jgi:hypothetical protein
MVLPAAGQHRQLVDWAAVRHHALAWGLAQQEDCCAGSVEVLAEPAETVEPGPALHAFRRCARCESPVLANPAWIRAAVLAAARQAARTAIHAVVELLERASLVPVVDVN